MPQRSPIRGWDWFSIVLDDGTELMLYILRTKQGMKSLRGTYINKDGKALDLSNFKIDSFDTWKSPKTKIKYPSGWKCTIPKLKISLKIVPVVKGQEFDKIQASVFAYWEGACDVSGSKGKKKVKGQSYVELVGYDQRLRTRILRTLLE